MTLQLSQSCANSPATDGSHSPHSEHRKQAGASAHSTMFNASALITAMAPPTHRGGPDASSPQKVQPLSSLPLRPQLRSLLVAPCGPPVGPLAAPSGPPEGPPHQSAGPQAHPSCAP
jgi:hypothetical protein